MRKLSLRERFMLACLAVVMVVSGYMVFFRTPLARRMENLEQEIAQTREVNLLLEEQLNEKRGMQQELERLAQMPDAPPVMPEYDNTQAVMKQLNVILDNCLEYSVSFSTTQAEDGVVRRTAVIPFTCTDYLQAEFILQQLHDNALRCTLDDVSLAQQDNGTVRGSVTMTFFEYNAAQ